jgi:hypothetical protein
MHDIVLSLAGVRIRLNLMMIIMQYTGSGSGRVLLL